MRPAVLLVAGCGLAVACSHARGDEATAAAPVARHTAALLAPTLSPEFSIGHPGMGAYLSYDESPTVTFDGTNYLVVWGQEDLDGWHVVGKRISPDGTVLDPTALRIGDGRYPKSAFDGASHFVAWANYGTTGASIRVRRVSPSGTVMDADDIVVSGSVTNAFGPRLTPCGGSVLVGWSNDSQISGVHLGQDGSLLDASPVVVASAGYAALCPTTNGCLATWFDPSSEVHAARLGSTGGALDPTDIVVAKDAPGGFTSQGVYPACGFDGTNDLVVWGRRDTSSSTVTGVVRGARIGPNGTLLDSTPLTLSDAPLAGSDTYNRIRVVHDGTSFLVIWVEQDDSRFDLHGARFDSNGARVDATNFLISTGPGGRGFPFVAAGPGHALVTWEDYRPVTLGWNVSEIFETRLAGSTVLDPEGVLLSTGASGKDSLALASDGTTFLAAFRDTRGGRLGTGGARIGINGAALDTEDVSLSARPDPPALAFDGSRYFAAWPHAVSRVAPDATVVDPGGIQVSDDISNRTFARSVACGRSACLSVWEREWLNGYNQENDIQAAIVRSDGSMLELPAADAGTTDVFDVSTAASAQQTPAAASDGTDFLVVWADCREDPSADRERCFANVYGARVTADGTVLDGDTSAMRISQPGRNHRAPAITYDSGSEQYLVVWQSSGDIAGARVTTNTGTIAVLDQVPGLVVSNADEEQAAPRIAYSGNGYDSLVVWEDLRDGTTRSIFGTWIRRDGTVPFPDGFSISATGIAEAAPVVASNGKGTLLVGYGGTTTYPSTSIAHVVGLAGRLITAPSADGTACTADEPCASGFCRDGVCCESDCAGECQSCALTPGRCLPVTDAEDPDTCSTQRACDGAGACRKKTAETCALGTDCVSGFCSDGICCNAACDQDCDTCSAEPGTCTVLSKGAVGPACSPGYVCDGVSPSCATRCASDSDCAERYWCSPESACVAFCTQNSDCGGLGRCNTETGRCVAGGKCDGEHTILALDGNPAHDKDCGTYRCSTVKNGCLTSCATSADCVAGMQCDDRGACGAPQPATAGGGSSCSIAFRHDRGGRWALTTWLLLILAARRRRRTVALLAAILLAPGLALGAPTISAELPLGNAQLTGIGGVGVPLPASDGTDFLVVFSQSNLDASAGRGILVSASGAVQDATGVALPEAPYAVAYGGGEYVVVSSDGFDVKGVRVSPGGQLLDVTPFLVAPGSQPAIAYCGTSFLVVFQAPTGGVAAVHLTPSGSVVEATPLTLSATGGLPNVAGSASQCLVVWTDVATVVTRVGNAGGPLDTPLSLHGPDNIGDRAVIASDGTDFLVVFHQYDSAYQLFRNRVTAAGAVVDDPAPQFADTSGSYSHPTAAWDGTQYLVAWSAGSSLKGLHVTGQGAVVESSAITLQTSVRTQGLPALTGTGSGALLAWGEASNDFASRVDPSGAADPPILLSTARGFQDAASVTSNGGGYLAVWHDTRGGQDDVYGARLALDGTVLDPDGIPIASTLMEESSPVVAFDGTRHLVAWSEIDPTRTQPSIVATRLDLEGKLTDPEPIRLDTNGKYASAPLAAQCASASCLVAWTENGSTGRDVAGAILRGDTQTHIVIAATLPAQEKPAIATDGTEYLVAWLDDRDGEPHVYATRVTAEGALRDGTGVAISATDVHLAERDVALAYDPDRKVYVAVWERAGDIQAARISPGGSSLTVLDPSPNLTISGADGQQSLAAVAYSGDGHGTVVVWQDVQPGGTRDVLGAWLNDDGTVTSVGPIAGGTWHEGRPRIASGDAGRLLVVYELDEATRFEARIGTLATRTIAADALDGTGCAADTECASKRCREGVCCRTECDTSCETCADPASPGVCTCTGLATCDGSERMCALKDGRACTDATDCSSGHCADGYCCDTACDQPCASCSSTPGTCQVAPKASLGRVVPAGDAGWAPVCPSGYLCDGLSPSCATTCGPDQPCAPNYFCSSSAQCTKYCSRDEECGPGSRCDARLGTCVSGATCDDTDDHHRFDDRGKRADCAPYLCIRTTQACGTRCTTSADCVKGSQCNEVGKCDPPSPTSTALPDVGCAVSALDAGRTKPVGVAVVVGSVGVVVLARRRRKTRRAGAR